MVWFYQTKTFLLYRSLWERESIGSSLCIITFLIFLQSPYNYCSRRYTMFSSLLSTISKTLTEQALQMINRYENTPVGEPQGLYIHLDQVEISTLLFKTAMFFLQKKCLFNEICMYVCVYVCVYAYMNFFTERAEESNNYYALKMQLFRVTPVFISDQQLRAVSDLTKLPQQL